MNRYVREKVFNYTLEDLHIWTFRATRILNADFITPYKPLMFFFLYISYYSVYFYSNLYYKHK